MLKNLYKNYKKTSLFVIFCVTFVLFYTLFGFFGVPWILKDIAPKFLADKNATLTIKEAKFNPYTFELNATGVKLSTYTEIFSVNELDVSLRFRELFFKNINIDVLRLNEPYINIQREQNASFNFESLLSDSTTQDDESSDGFFNITLNSFKLINGDARYADNSLKKPFVVNLKDISYEIEGVNLKEHSVGKHTLDTNSTLFDEFDWKGGVSLKPLKIYGDIKFAGLKMDKIWQSYVGDGDINISKGFLDTRLNYSVDIDSAGVGLNLNESEILARDVNVSSKSDNIVLKNLGFKNLNLDSKFSGKNSLKLSLDEIYSDSLAFNQNSLTGIKFIKPTLRKDLSENYSLNVKDINVTKTSLKSGEFDLAIDAVFANELDISYVAKEGRILINLPKFGSSFIGLNAKDEKFAALKSLEGLNLGLKDDKVNLKSATLSNFELFSKAKGFAGFLDTSINEIEFDTLNTSLLVKNIAINSLFFNDEIGQNGSKAINNLKFLNQKSKKEPSKNASKFVANIENIDILNASSNITQSFLKEPLKHKILVKNAKISDLSTDFTKPFKVGIKLNTSESINLDLSGKIALEPFASELNVKLGVDELAGLNSLTSQYLNAKITGGSAKINANLTLDKSVKVGGNLALDNLSIDDKNGTKIAALKSLNIKKIKLDTKSVMLDKVELKEPFIKAWVSKDRSFNLAKILKDDKSSKSSDSTESFKFGIKDVSLSNASVDFGDESLVLPFMIGIKNLNANIDKIESNRVANIVSNGVVGSGGSANLDIKIDAFNPKKFSQIALKFKDIELSEATPYSATFVGRKIDGGTLDLDLFYDIKDHKMQGKNDIRIDTIKLGESVESRDAMSLPLSLAISVLKDSNNVINLNLPVKGDLDNPEFSYGGIVIKAILQIFTDVVTSPFRLLGNVLGISNADELSSVDFTAGSDDVMQSQSKKIENFAQIAKSKNDVIFVISPAFDEVVDKFAIQKRLLDREISMIAGTTKNDLEVINEMAKKQFKTPVPDVYKALIENKKISSGALDELAISRAKALQETMIKAGVPSEQIKISDKTQNVNSQMQLYIPLPMGIEKR